MSDPRFEQLLRIEAVAHLVVERWRWDLANQPEIRALAHALRGVEIGERVPAMDVTGGVG